MTLPVTVIVVTKNEEQRILACLQALTGFAEIVVVDSASRDRTKILSQDSGARVVDFVWNGQYPKKRQWVLDHVPLQTDWILWMDADELMTPELLGEISEVFASGPAHDGYFIKGLYRIGGRLLRHGLPNNKLVLFNRHKFKFPVIEDLDIPGMGEIEGHYQPVAVAADVRIGSLRHPLIHTAYEDQRAWIFRHEKYARWEVGMNAKNAWPLDPVPWRQRTKVWLRQTRWRPQIVFLISYIGLGGFLDGRAGYQFAVSRYRYYIMIQTLEGKLA